MGKSNILQSSKEIDHAFGIIFRKLHYFERLWKELLPEEMMVMVIRITGKLGT